MVGLLLPARTLPMKPVAPVMKTTFPLKKERTGEVSSGSMAQLEWREGYQVLTRRERELRHCSLYSLLLLPWQVVYTVTLNY